MNSVPEQRHDADSTKPLEKGLHCPHCRESFDGTIGSAPLTCSACGKPFRVFKSESEFGLREGQGFGHFLLLQFAGAGTFGVVWKARDVNLDRVVALKIPHRSWLSSENYLERLGREARAAAHLNHPNILSLIAVETIDDVPVLVTDFINGVTLEKWLETNKQPGFREAASWGAQLARALDYAHREGVIHRDVKPGNILLEKLAGEGPLQPKLIDFGLALRDQTEMVLTMDGQIIGTPAYMSPEQALGKGHPFDGRSDIYSLGVVLYRMVTGVLPFHGPAAKQIELVLKGSADSPRRIDSHIPRDLETIILKAMAREPWRRFARAADLADELERFRAGQPIQSRPVSRFERALLWARRNPALAAACGMAMLALVGLFTALVAFNISKANYIESLQRQTAIKELETGTREATDNQRVDVALFHYLDALANAPPRSADIREEARWNLSAWPAELFALDAIRTVEMPNLLLSQVDIKMAGKDLATWDGAGDILLWKTDKGEDELTGLLHGENLQTFSFSGDGRLLATASNGVLRLYKVNEGKLHELATMPVSAKVACLEFSPLARSLAIASQSGLQICDLAASTPLVTGTAKEQAIAEMWFAGEDALVTRVMGELLVWRDLRGTCKSSTRFDLPEPTAGRRIVAVHRGALAAAADGNQVRFVDLTREPTSKRSGSARPTIQLSQMPLTMAFSPDGTTLATVAGQKMVQLWDVATGRPKSAPQSYRLRIPKIVFHPDGRSVFVNDMEQTIRRLRIPESREITIPHAFATGVHWTEFFDGGKSLMAVSVFQSNIGSAAIRFFAIPSFQPIGKPFVHRGYVSPRLSTDGTLVAYSRARQAIDIGEVKTGETLDSLPVSAQAPQLAWAHQAHILVIGEDTDTVRLRDVESRNDQFLKLPTGQFVSALATSPRDDVLIVGTLTGQISAWNLTSRQPLYTLPTTGSPFQQIHFSPDGRFFAAIDTSHVVRIRRVNDGCEVGRELMHEGIIHSFAWSDDSQVAATGSEAHMARLWDVSTGQTLGTPIDLGMPVFWVFLNPDRRTLLANSSGGKNGFWYTPTCRQIGPGLGRGTAITSVALSPDGSLVARGGRDGSVTLRPVPRPVPDQVDKLRLWVQVLTGLESDPTTGGRTLSREEWLEKKRLLDSMGGPPSP